ncbi:MAG: sulfotransferase family protein [Bacteroidota bacterium]
MALKVIGAGYGRTGTKSLQLALEILGFGKCYHMEALFRNPEGVTHWKSAYLEQQVDWDALFEGYGSAVDFPVSMYYQELAAHFPDSKVILTTRDPEKWYESAHKTIFSFDPGPGLKIKMLFSMLFSSKARNLFKVIQLNDKSIWGKLFEGKFKDREYAIQNFKNHSEAVKRNIPPHRLLEFHPSQGWEPLCQFLGVDIPTEPFPNTNTRENFHDWAKGIVKEVLS